MEKLESETVEVLPERVETSYFSATVSQGNLGIQIGGAGLQAMGQLNLAGIFVVQH